MTSRCVKVTKVEEKVDEVVKASGKDVDDKHVEKIKVEEVAVSA